MKTKKNKTMNIDVNSIRRIRTYSGRKQEKESSFILSRDITINSMNCIFWDKNHC